MGKKANSKKPNKALRLSIWGVCVAAIIGVTTYGTIYAKSWDKALTSYMGTIGGSIQTSDDDSKTTDEKLADLNVKQEELVGKICAEGGVLLKNDNQALPLSKNSKVSVFGTASGNWLTKEKFQGKSADFTASLESAGLTLNPNLKKLYRQTNHTKWGKGANLGNGGIAGDWALDEIPQSEYTADLKASYSSYNDAAIVVFSRCGSEGGDLPRNMGRYGGSDDETYLDLSTNEKDLLKSIKDSGQFHKTIVVIHTGNAMSMDFVTKDEYGIDSVLWISGTGANGVAEMGKYFTGEINPSGKATCTWEYDTMNNPVMQNFGDYRFVDSSGNTINSTSSTVGGTYSYMNYGEGIYMGYRYFETRYEDSVLKQGNYGSYNYDKTVFAPFGSGLSYTDFTWSDYSVSAPDESGNIEASIKVTNTGSYAGKDVVELYYQFPYTDYDKTNGIEKSAINLGNFAKTGLIQPGESQTVTLTLNVEDMASYDSYVAKTYLLEAGDYYLTIAKDAHDGINSILSSKGKTTGDGMTKAGETSRVKKITLDETKKYDSSKGGEKVTNQFEDAELKDAKYLSRSNWSVLDSYSKSTLTGGIAYTSKSKQLGLSSGGNTVYSDVSDSNGTVGVHGISDELLASLKSENWANSGNPVSMDDASWPEVKFEQSGNLKLEDLVGTDFNDSKWDSLVSQMSLSEAVSVFGKSGWGTQAIDSVGKPQTYYMDGPAGLIDYVSGGQGYQFQTEAVLSATWNLDLAYEQGDLISQEFKLKGVCMWWAPAMNLYRSAYSGRNFEYFSEDGVQSGLMGSKWVQASSKNGVACNLKHFFLNDQETNRGCNGRVATFATEQAMREIYLKPFQICVEEGGAQGVMATMSRVGAICSPCRYSLMTTVLRDEWGMKGVVITDAQSFTPGEAEQAIGAGCDMVDSNMATSVNASTYNSKGGQYMLHQMMKRILQTTSNTCVFSIKITTGFPIYNIYLINLWAFVAMMALYGTGEVLCGCYPEQKVIKQKTKWIIRGIVWAIALACLIYVLVMFFTTWLPALKFAFQTVQ